MTRIFETQDLLLLLPVLETVRPSTYHHLGPRYSSPYKDSIVRQVTNSGRLPATISARDIHLRGQSTVVDTSGRTQCSVDGPFVQTPVKV